MHGVREWFMGTRSVGGERTEGRRLSIVVEAMADPWYGGAWWPTAQLSLWLLQLCRRRRRPSEWLCAWGRSPRRKYTGKHFSWWKQSPKVSGGVSAKFHSLDKPQRGVSVWLGTRLQNYSQHLIVNVTSLILKLSAQRNETETKQF